MPVLKRLSGKLLRLTLLFGLLAEVMIFVPTIADMRIRWLSDRLNTVAAASVVLAASDAKDVPQSVQDDVLLATGTKAIALKENGASRLLAVSDMPSKVDKHIDITVTDPLTMIRGAFDELIYGGDRIIRVYGPVGDTGKVIELLTSDAPSAQCHAALCPQRCPHLFVHLGHYSQSRFPRHQPPAYSPDTANER